MIVKRDLEFPWPWEKTFFPYSGNPDIYILVKTEGKGEGGDYFGLFLKEFIVSSSLHP